LVGKERGLDPQLLHDPAPLLYYLQHRSLRSKLRKRHLDRVALEVPRANWRHGFLELLHPPDEVKHRWQLLRLEMAAYIELQFLRVAGGALLVLSYVGVRSSSSR
jgi:hypothetical protein